MEKSIDSVRRNFGTVRTGRANTSILDRIQARALLRSCARRAASTCAHADAHARRGACLLTGGILRRDDAAEEHGQRVHAGRADHRHPAV
jgi:hypothetical protein